MNLRVCFRVVFFVFILVLLKVDCFAQGDRQKDDFEIFIVIPATQVYNGTIAINGQAYTCTEFSLLWVGPRTLEGSLTEGEYEELLELIDRSGFFDMHNPILQVPYNEDEIYKIRIRFKDRQNEIDFCPEDNKLYELVEKIIEITSFNIS